ncbi:MAG: YlzJ-like family protein [Bacillota bacterium]|jgi:hypothetical protein
MIWSIVPEEVIFEGAEQKSSFKQIIYQGRMVIVTEDAGRRQIVRLVSSNPHDYLDSRFAPGTIINI